MGDEDLGIRTIFDWSWNYTREDGCVSWPPFDNNDGWLEDGYDIFFHIEASTDATIIGKNDGTKYVFETDTISNHPDGSYVYNISADVNADSTFWMWNIYDAILTGYSFAWGKFAPNPPQVNVRWEPGQCPYSTGYDRNNKIIYICGNSNNEHHKYPGIILHEYGHHIANSVWSGKPYTFDCSSGGGHYWCEDGEDTRLSWSEGWAHFFSCAARGENSISGNEYCCWSVINAETGDVTLPALPLQPCDGCAYCNANSLGKDNEISVAGILWDLYDSQNDDQDGDGIGDEISNYDIFSVLKNSPGICTLDDFWNALPSKNYHLWATFYEHGVNYDSNPPTVTITSGPSGITKGDVSFTWTGSDDYTSTSDLLYSYYLEGYDSGWSSWTSSTSKTYNGLPAGKSYTFRVKAKDKAGNVGPESSRSFTVYAEVCFYPLPSGSGTIIFNNKVYSSGCDLYNVGTYSAEANPSSGGWIFDTWESGVASKIYIHDPSSRSTLVDVGGDGNLIAKFDALVTFYTNPQVGGSITVS
ncbi:MAG: hypothetical protein DSO07_02815, partial [Thermoproteota archaeon]